MGLPDTLVIQEAISLADVAIVHGNYVLSFIHHHQEVIWRLKTMRTL